MTITLFSFVRSTAVMMFAFGSLFVSALLAQDTVPMGDCREKNERLRTSLDKRSSMYKFISDGETGDGVSKAWMPPLKRNNIRQATAVVQFVLSSGHLKLSMDSIDFYSQYYEFDKRITDTNSFSPSTRKQLQTGLELYFFVEAIGFLHNYAGKSACGTLNVSLLDDACLPAPIPIPSVDTNCTQAPAP